MSTTPRTDSPEASTEATPPDEPAARQRVGVASGARSVLLRPELALPLITLALFLYLTFANEFFFSERNLLNITAAVALVGIAAAFATIVLISGGIDLSPVVVFIMAGLVCQWALARGVPVPITIVMGLGAGAAIGLLNGVLVAVGQL